MCYHSLREFCFSLSCQDLSVHSGRPVFLGFISYVIFSEEFVYVVFIQKCCHDKYYLCLVSLSSSVSVIGFQVYYSLQENNVCFCLSLILFKYFIFALHWYHFTFFGSTRLLFPKWLAKHKFSSALFLSVSSELRSFNFPLSNNGPTPSCDRIYIVLPGH